MTSWYSKAYSAATSQISSLRSTLLSSDADGDTEDDTHVCRVLRGYYTEKGRPFPAWLPPDPKAPPPVAPPMPIQAAAAMGSLYGNFNSSSNTNGGAATAPPATGLSSLWSNDSSGGGGGGGGGIPNQPKRGPGGRIIDFGDQPERSASAGVVTSAHDRFRNKMYGSRTASPAPSGPYAPPRSDRDAGGSSSGERRGVGLPSGSRMR